MTKLTDRQTDYVGKIKTGVDSWSIGNRSLKDIVGDFELEDIRLVSLYINNEPIPSFDEAEKQYIYKFFGKPISWEYEDLFGSEWTGWYGADLDVDFQNARLQDILESNDGKYIALRIKYKE